jgi:spore maturation protein CgeB
VKLLALVSALDLRYRYSSTPHWWQLLKAVAKEGVDVLAVPYHGPAVESLHWRVRDNPCQWEGEAFYLMRRWLRAAGLARGGSGSDTAVQTVIDLWIRPRWKAFLARTLREERRFDAVVMFNLPMDHMAGLAAYVRSTCGAPVWYYDGDLPATLPGYGAFATGFVPSGRASYAEYDGFFSNSRGSVARLAELGAKRVEVVHWGADLDVYRPLERAPETDVFFYGYGEQYREDWMEAMVYEPSRRLPGRTFTLGGPNFARAPASVRRLDDVPFNLFNEQCARARVNLIVTRNAHASVAESSSARPFELGAMGCATVSNPWLGLETWFEPGKEVLVVDTVDRALAVYEELLGDEKRRAEMGRAMRRRVEAEHTYGHRARQMLAALKG